MVIKLKFSALSQDQWYDYAIRFVLGGLATVATSRRLCISVAGVLRSGQSRFQADPSMFQKPASHALAYESKNLQLQGASGRPAWLYSPRARLPKPPGRLGRR
jgi:hypothetical protein